MKHEIEELVVKHENEVAIVGKEIVFFHKTTGFIKKGFLLKIVEAQKQLENLN
jgi:hypothetical protein